MPLSYHLNELTCTDPKNTGHAEVIAHTAKDPREYCISTKSFEKDEEGNLKGLNTVRVEWTEKGGKWSMEEIPGSEQVRHRSTHERFSAEF